MQHTEQALPVKIANPLRRFHLLFFGLALLACLSGCGQIASLPPATPTPTLSPQARSYLTAALDIMQQHSINRKHIDWVALRQQAFRDASGARTPAETYAAISAALRALGDQHSFFIDPQRAHQQTTSGIGPGIAPDGQRLSHGIGYLELPGFVGSEQAGKNYAMLAQDALRHIDRTPTCGWIVDLRPNNGGNMWPMLAGVGPILGDGVVGSFVFADESKLTWGYFHGQAQLAGSPMLSIPTPYHLKRPDPPVAVLTNHNTISAGEAIAVAFRARPRTRSFGGPTYGLPTANQPFTLSDGAELALTVAVDADRTGQTYESAIVPDESISPARDFTMSGPDVQAATTWLHQQEGC